MLFKRETLVALSIAGSLHAGMVVALMFSTPPEPLAVTLDHSFEMVELAPLAKLTTPSTPLSTPLGNVVEAHVIETSEAHQSPAEPVAEAEAVPKPEPVITPALAVAIPEVVEIAEQPQPETVAIPEPEATPPKAQSTVAPTRKVLTAGQTRELPLVLASIDDVYIPPVSHSRYRHNPKPRYPHVAKKRGMEGLVMVSVHVGRDGRPLEALIHTSSGYGVLDRAALKTIRNWHFEAARRGNTPVEGKVLVPINFELTNSRG